MYAHTRNLYYQKNGVSVTVLNFRAKRNYELDGVRVITLDAFRKNPRNYRILILHAANLRNHYAFLKRYGGWFDRFVFFFHGHEALRINAVYSKPYDFMKKNRFSMLQDMYDAFKLRVWRAYLPRLKERAYFIFVSRWMYEQFLLNTGIDESVLQNRHSIIYNSVGSAFSDNTWREDAPKDFDFVTIRSNLDNSKYAVDIVNRLAFNTPDMKFLLIGRGVYFQRREKAPNLIWIDSMLSHAEILSYLDASRFALMPTRTDAQGLMMCEMAAYGMPLITSDIPVCREVFSGFPHVDYIDNNDERLSLDKYRSVPATVMKDTRYFLENTCSQELRILSELM